MRWKEESVTGWGRALRAEAEVARPERLSDLPEKLGPAIGGRRSYGDAALNGGGRAIDMTRLDRILSFDPASGKVEVEAGVTIGTLLRVFAPQGWMPAVMPGTGFATVGGAIAMDVHGKNHHHAGSFGGHVTAITLLQEAGEVRITPRNRALWQATIGGLGQTGIITKAVLQLARTPGTTMEVRERRAEGWDEHLAMLDASQATYCVSWIDATATGEAMGRGILEEAELCATRKPAASHGPKVPTDAPGFALSAPIVKAFNAIYFRRVPAEGRSVVRPMADFFFPLDRIHDWNRLYGKRGFHQFQCVVPEAAKGQIKTMMQEIAGAGLASPLAVLKRMGPGRAGYLSFPMEGYTLAVDFPNRGRAGGLIGRLIDMTAEAGGRIYFAKDSLARAEQIGAMYPDLGKWQAAVAKADPGGIFETDMTRRLGLRGSE
jgi:decaprenylphospho-beta-D-ribofuranose 2-oxidase